MLFSPLSIGFIAFCKITFLKKKGKVWSEKCLSK